MLRTLLRTTACLATVLAVTVCGGDSATEPSVARVQILLTDAPSDYIAAAEIWISRVYLMPGAMDDDSETEGEGEEEGQGQNPRVDLFNDPENPLHYDLLTLRDGLAADLTDLTEVPEGEYGKLRLVVDRAEVTLIEGVLFKDGTDVAALKVPSGSKSGLKVKLAEVITAEAGTTTIVTVDFDVDQNFRLQGNPENPRGLNGVLFTPNLKELKREEEDGSET